MWGERPWSGSEINTFLTENNLFFSNGEQSSMQNLKCGVPQGSLLGPLLFLIYINDIQHSSKLLSFILFADDSNIFFSHPDPCWINLNNKLWTRIRFWLVKSQQINSQCKQTTKFMLFSNSISNLPGNVTFNNIVLDKVDTIKFLGQTIDEILSWKIHIDNISKTISRNIGIINKLKSYFPPSTLLMLYSTMILPYLNYGILAWGNSNKHLMDRLYLLQKKANSYYIQQRFLFPY